MERFKITNSSQEKKKFEIKTKPERPKKFEIKKERVSKEREINSLVHFEGENIPWSQQVDLTSCGYCMIQNSAHFLNIERNVDTHHLHNEINEIHSRLGHNLIERSNMLNTNSIYEYYLSKGFSIDSYSSIHDINEILESIDNDNIKLIVSTANRHYTGIAPKGESYILLDSLKEEPLRINKEALIERIKESLGRDELRNRYNILQIIKKKKFKIKK